MTTNEPEAWRPGTQAWWHRKGDDYWRQPVIVLGVNARRRVVVETVGVAQRFNGVVWNTVAENFAGTKLPSFGKVHVVRAVVASSLRRPQHDFPQLRTKEATYAGA